VSTVTEPPSAEEWQAQIDWYRTLIEKYGRQQRPMLDFVRWLAASEYASWIHPSQSHAALGLSTVRDYGDRRKRPMVYLQCENHETSFVLVFQEGQGNTVHSLRVVSPRDETSMKQIVNWLRRDVLFDR
jgi:hypothetical protein